MTSLRERPHTALLVIDVQTDVDKVIAHTNSYWNEQAAPGRTAGVVATADVDFVVTQDKASA